MSADHDLLDRLADLRPQPPAAVDVETVLRLGARRRRRRRLSVVAVAGPVLAAALSVPIVFVSHGANGTARLATAGPLDGPPRAPALAAPDARTVAYFSPYDWLERAPTTAEPAVSREQAIAVYETERADLRPGLRSAPITAVLGVYHRVNPADGSSRAGTALPLELAWAVVQGPYDAGRGDTLRAIDVPGAKTCYAAAAVDATAPGKVGAASPAGVPVEQDCSYGVRNPIIAAGRAAPNWELGSWATLHPVLVPVAPTAGDASPR